MGAESLSALAHLRTCDALLKVFLFDLVRYRIQVKLPKIRHCPQEAKSELIQETSLAVHTQTVKFLSQYCKKCGQVLQLHKPI